jgi:carbon monoxide dehydrogenase subunit G
MTIIESSIEINSSPETVFAFLTNLDNLKLQNPGILSITLNGPLAVGTRYTTHGQVMGRDFSTETEIIEVEPNKKFSIKTLAAPPVPPVTNTYVLESSGSGTKLTSSMDAVVMAPMPGMEDMIKGQLKTAIDTSNAALKKLIEG